jgi:DeoR/GlpR family transcriptional regulator of sugar metabolism
MFVGERRRRILEMLRASGAVSLRDLADVLQTSEVTVRRDLRSLEADGLLVRRHGGAVIAGGLTHELSYLQKTAVAAPEKVAIANTAVGMIVPGDAIIIGVGSTTLELASRLTGFSDLTVVTNSLLVAQALARASGVEVVMTGGSLRGSTYALVGPATEAALAGLHVRCAFLSGNGLTPERGLSTPNMLAAAADRAIAASAREVVVLADHTKLGVDAMFQTVAVSQMTALVTDSGADPDILQAMRDRAVEVYVADVAAPVLPGQRAASITV